MMSSDMTVFVVDDDEIAAASLVALLTSVGHKVEAYLSAEDFLAAYDGVRKGCLILDVRLKGMSGPELQEELAAKEMNIPVILVSGHLESQIAARQAKHRTITCLEKPFASADLYDAVRAAESSLQDQSACQ